MSAVLTERDSLWLRRIEEQGCRRIAIGVVDLDGAVRGPTVSAAALETMLQGDAVTGSAGEALAIDHGTLRISPWEPGVATVLASRRDGLCSRAALARLIGEGKPPTLSLGLDFWLFDADAEPAAPEDAAALGSWVGAGARRRFVAELLDELEAYGVGVEHLNLSADGRRGRASLAAAPALAACDAAVGFKLGARAVAREQGLAASFMPALGPRTTASLRVTLPEADAPCFGELAALWATCAPSVTGYKARRQPPVERKNGATTVVVPASTAPHLAVAGILAARNGAGEAGEDLDAAWPAHLGEAVTRLRRSATARDALGDPLVDALASQADAAWRDFCHAVSDWDRARHL